jgi:hypothetical protein
MKQTAVEWLEGQILNLMSFDTIDFRKEFREKIEQAKAMEKEQIINANNRGWKVARESIYELGEQYYNETYKQDESNT